MIKNIIVALDEQDPKKLETQLEKLIPHFEYFKVGLESYYAHGSSLIEKLKNKNKKVFLDLKIHDIPNTMIKSLRVLNKLEVDMINIHALSGVEAMKGCREVITKSRLISVTLLTSMDQISLLNLGLQIPLKQLVLNLAGLSYQCGLDGVVCSAMEVESIKKNTSSNFITVTPGIRLNNHIHHDQKRVFSPKDAFKVGADFLVMGRELTETDNLERTLLKLKESIDEIDDRQNIIRTRNFSNQL